MKIQVIGFMVALVPLMTFASTMECSSSDGKVRISAFAYEGGAQPQKGLETSRESWSYEGVIVGARSHVHGAPSGAVYGQLGEILDQTTVIVDNSNVNVKPDGTMIYAAKAITAKSKTGKEKITVSVLCTKTFATVQKM